ncbi:hypothetical protein Nepgr_028163 [Nepenthes gracilis]|uniref:Meiosis-specific protein ASY3-like coiled-coil domain-containing protein n=1 Tax=Nepenthes gracilis TaxID=150966 RepID=A0AAD3TB64_NEPGR|nr:hypothetical protein Nepgr_028163 [Nepenthes gracilis]
MANQRWHKLQEDCTSFGSNYQPSGQSRKMSIGIVVDSLSAKPKFRLIKEDNIFAPSTEKEAPNVETLMEVKDRKKEAPSACTGNRRDAEMRKGSPWITTRSRAKNMLTGESPDIDKKISSVAAIGVFHNKLSGIDDSKTKDSVHFSANQAILESADGKKKKLGMFVRTKDENDATIGKVGEFSDAAAPVVGSADERVLQDKTNGPDNRKILIMNLWETLGPSPNDQFSNVHTVEVAGNDVKQEQSYKQSAPARVLRKKLRNKRSSGEKERHQQRRSFSFKEQLGGQPDALTDSPCMSQRKSDVQSCGIKTTDTLYPEKNMGTIQQAELISKRPTPAESKSPVSLTGMETKDSHCSSKMKYKLGKMEGPALPENLDHLNPFPGQSSQNNASACYVLKSPDAVTARPLISNRNSDMKSCGIKTSNILSPVKDIGDIQQAKFIGKNPTSSENKKSLTGIQTKGFRFLSGVKDQMRDMKDPASPENVVKPKDFSSGYPRENASPYDDCRSPLFKMETAAQSCLPSSLAQANETEHKIHGLAQFFDRDTCTFKSRLTRSQDISGSDMRSESSDGKTELKDSSVSTPLQPTVNNDAENVLFTPKSGEFDSFDAKTYVNKVVAGYSEDIDTSPEIGPVAKPMLCQKKRLRSQEGVEYRVFVSTSCSTEATGGSDEMLKDSFNQTKEDELERAVALFGSALERVKRKMMSVTKKRCLDILMASAEEVNQHLKIVESQIQTDKAKLTSLSKSKKKCLEAKFQEQQEQVKHIHMKFKEEINRQLQDCESTVEELEAQQSELKGAVEKQKASHRKLLLQVEEAVQSHLLDVEKRITCVHELGREKMMQLKRAIAECLKDSIDIS